jgi:transposase
MRFPCLHEWTKAHLQDGAAAFPGSGHQTPAEAELRQLRAEVKRLEMERDILKKATAFFAALTK